MYYIKKLRLVTQNGIVSELSLTSGLNIVYGASNTGKSLVLECINYLCGGDSEKLEDPALKIKDISLTLDVDGDELTLTRNVGSREIEAIGNPSIIGSGVFNAKTSSKKKPSIGSLWLRLMGINEPVQIYQYKNGSKQNLSLRTFIHSYLINEDRMIDSRSILKNSEGFGRNIPVSTITSLIYLATEKNFITNEEDNKTDGRLLEQRKFASQRIVNRSLLALSQKNFDNIAPDEETRTVDELTSEINTILEQISAAESSLDAAMDLNQKLSGQILDIDDNLSESKLLRKRYDALRSQYESDVKRLTFIAEGDVHKSDLLQLTHCPFCNGELPKEKSQSCVDAAVAEVMKIELKIQDLQSADKDIEEEIDSLTKKRICLINERKRTQSIIRGQLKPQIEFLKSNLREFTIAMERAKAKEMIESMVSILKEEQRRADAEDDSELELGFNVESRIKEYLSPKFDKYLMKILSECHFDNLVDATFDINSCDVVVNGRNKATQGKGIKAYLNTVMAIVIQETLREYDLHETNLLVLDSPIMSLKEKKYAFDDNEKTSEPMKAALFRYLVNNSSYRQVIVLENSIPDIDYKDSNLIEFTKDENRGRYGLLVDYTE